MAAKKILSAGTWYAGFHTPFFVSNAAVASALGGFGLTNIQFFDRDKVTPPVNPKLDPHYDDNWDTWLQATYSGAPQSFEMPDQVDWLLHTPTPAKPGPVKSPPVQQTPPKEASGGGGWLLVLLVLVLARKR